MKLNSPKILHVLLIAAILLLPGSSQAQTCPSPYGINVHVPDSQTLQLIQNAGIKWIRVDFNWSQIETSAGQFNWLNSDTMVNEAWGRGLCLLGNLFGTPPWASAGGGPNDPPSQKTYWTNFIDKIVSRYGGKIKYWSMWNEPNLEQFWKGTVDDYMDLILIPGSETAGTIDPSCKIVGPDLAHLHSQNARWNIWLRQILRNGGKDHLDVISHHIYDSQGPSGLFSKIEKDQAPLIPSVIKVLEEEGVDNKPFWITETGWDTTVVSEDTQADYYLEFLQNRGERPYISKIFFYQILDDPDPEAPRFGIVSDSFVPKKAYTVYKDFIAGLYPPPDSLLPEEDEGICPFIEATGQAGENQVRSLDYVRFTRDTFLKKTIRGNAVVRTYYQFAPEALAILRDNPSALWLAADCIEPVIDFCEQVYMLGKEKTKEIFLSVEDFDNLRQLITLFKHQASPDFLEVLEAAEKELPKYKERSLYSLIIDLDFDNTFLIRRTDRTHGRIGTIKK